MSTPTLHFRFSHPVLNARKTLALVYAEEGFWMFWEGEGDAVLFYPAETIAPLEAALKNAGMAIRSDLQKTFHHLWISLYEWVREGGTCEPDLGATATELVRFIEAVNAVHPPEMRYKQPPPVQS